MNATSGNNVGKKVSLGPKEASLALRAAFGAYPTGVTIVTCLCPDSSNRIGVTANSFTSVSMDPPMISWNLGKNAFSLNAFSKVKHFAVHVLRADQLELARRFATKGGPKFEGLEIKEGLGTAPLFNEYLARFECKTTNIVEAGDHVVFFGEVEKLEIEEHHPLVFYRSKFHDGSIFVI